MSCGVGERSEIGCWMQSRCNIKVEHVLFGPQGLVQLYCRVIQLVGLDIYDVGTPLAGYML